MRDDKKYMEEHHAATETAIGLCQLYLERGDIDKAIEAINDCCKKIDEAIIKYQPATARVLGLTDKANNDERTH